MGSGAWGTTLALLLASKGLKVRLVCRRKEIAEDILCNRENSSHLPGVKLPPSIDAIYLSENSLSDSEHIVLAITSQHMREMLACPAFHKLKNGVRILHAAKGLEHYCNGKLSGRRMSQVLAEALKLDTSRASEIAVLSGPNIASEIAAGNYAETVIACKDRSIAKEWRDIFAIPNRFVLHVSDDVAGVEFCGALKNIVAMACGMVDGLGLGENTKSAIISRRLDEIISIGLHYGARRETFYGLAGLFDLDVTCHSKFSRNRLVGERVAQGKPLQTVLGELIAERRGEPEGPEMAKVVYELNGHLNLPVLKMVYNVLFNNRSASFCVKELLSS